MGLFDKASHRNRRKGGKKKGNKTKKKGGKGSPDEGAGAEFDASAWAVALDRGETNTHGKRDFGGSMSGHETIATTDDDASASVALSDGADKVRLLERRLHQSEATVARLREAMEAGERVQSDRIALLERQLERLVEFPSSGHERRERFAGRVRLDPGKKGSSSQVQDASPEERRFKLEMSALNELLARVLAEKDQLGSENKCLRSLLAKHRSGHSRVDKFPPSIVELDTIIKMKNKENRWEQGNCQYSLGPSTPPEGVPSVLYRMSCRDCPQDQSRLQYVGTYSPANPADSVNELTRVVKAHCSQVWRMVLEENGGPSPNSPGEWDGDGCGFPTSTLARHLVEQCKCFSSEEEVMQWFGDNVKVEVQRNAIKDESAKRIKAEVPGRIKAEAAIAITIKAERKERKERIFPPRMKKRWR